MESVEAVDSLDTVSLVAALIDESGSMLGVRDETLGGYNAFLDSVRTEQAGKRCYVSTFLFDLHADAKGREPVVRILQDAVDLADAKPLSLDQYNPRGSTPLFDAIGLAIAAIRKPCKALGINRVTFMIQTDGHENASVEYTHEQAKAAIAQCVAEGWQVIFLGADLRDARVVGMGLGVSASNSMAYAKSATGSTFSAMAASTQAYRSSTQSGAGLELTEQQVRDLGAA